MRISERGGISALNASVNSGAPSPPPPLGLAQGISIFFFRLELQIPGGWDSWAVKNPGVGT